MGTSLFLLGVSNWMGNFGGLPIPKLGHFGTASKLDFSQFP